jgi:hypothetical protein
VSDYLFVTIFGVAWGWVIGRALLDEVARRRPGQKP